MIYYLPHLIINDHIKTELKKLVTRVVDFIGTNASLSLEILTVLWSFKFCSKPLNQ